jgi:hypothetical protein
MAKFEYLILSDIRTHIKRLIPNDSTDLARIESVNPSLIDALNAPHDVDDDRLALVPLVESFQSFVEAHGQHVVWFEKLLHRGEALDVSRTKS